MLKKHSLNVSVDKSYKYRLQMLIAQFTQISQRISPKSGLNSSFLKIKTVETKNLGQPNVSPPGTVSQTGRKF